MSIARTAATGDERLDPEFLAWSSSLAVDRRMLAVDCRGSMAHVSALEKAGLLDAGEALTLREHLSQLPQRVERGEVELPAEEDVHMAVESWLRANAGPVADKLHTARSRNDQVATDLKLWIREATVEIERAIMRVHEAVASWQSQHGEIAMPAYTHRQVAIPTLARLWLDAALTAGLVRDARLLGVVWAEVERSPLGAGAVGGTTLPLDPSVAATELGFQAGPVNPIDAVGERDHALTLAFACTRIGLHLARFCSDIVELCADGLCKLSGAIACGSSMMPHKRNPDLFELVRAQAAMRHGELTALLGTFHGLGSGYHRDLQQDKTIVFAAVDGVLASLRMIELALPHVSLDEAACVRVLREGDAIATDLTEVLVAHGMAFRDAYQCIGRLVAVQRAAGKRLVDLVEADLDAAGLPSVLLRHLDPVASAKQRAAKFPLLAPLRDGARER